MSVGRYELIDFGHGRKLESLAGYLVDRPSPAAEHVTPALPRQWSRVDAVYDANSRRWKFRQAWPDALHIDCGAFVMPVRPTPFGHIGVFPEQADNWRWLSARQATSSHPAALNLFGYTGASTLALLTAGYHVAHVDAAKPNVQALRQAAELNGHAEAPIRYLIDDAGKFTAREVRRGRRYHTIVLDPPAYGHGPTGKAWRLERDLDPLLQNCIKLLDRDDFRLLITGHSPQVSERDVMAMLQQSPIGGDALRLSAGRSQLSDASGRKLDAGFYVRAAGPKTGQ